MRFNMAAVLLAVVAGSAIAAPAPRVESRSLVTEVGSLVAQLEDGLGVTELEEQLDALLGNSLSKLEEKLGVTFAEKILELSDADAKPGDLQAIGEGIAMLEKGLGITAVNNFLDKETGGAISNLEEALGVTDIEEALGLA